MGRAYNPDLVRIRSQRLLASWGPRTAQAMALRYVAEARRSGNALAIGVALAVQEDLQALLKPPV